MRIKMVTKSQTLKDAAKEFLAYKKAQKIRERTLKDYRKYIDPFSLSPPTPWILMFCGGKYWNTLPIFQQPVRRGIIIRTSTFMYSLHGVHNRTTSPSTPSTSSILKNRNMTGISNPQQFRRYRPS